MSVESSYQKTIDYLFNLQKHGIKLELSNSFRLMELMNNPHGAFPSLHVAGTNGKGSTAAFLSGMLQAAGYRVGLYTSPHLVDFTERIRINNVPIPEAAVVRLAAQLQEAYHTDSPAGDSYAIDPTFFEVTTALAFTYFAEEGIDIAVVETGMGGRLDSTNVITPLVSVITNIDLEHREYLGNTLGEIAAEKAGIIKATVPVVTGVIQSEAVTVLLREAAAQQAPVYRLRRDFMPEAIILGREQTFDYHGLACSYPDLRISMLGAYQVDNACLALAALECLRNSGFLVDEQAIRRGLEQTHWEGRMERVAVRPDIYLDGAHNPASAKRLGETLKTMKPAYQKMVLVVGILADKDHQQMISELVPLADHVVVTKPRYFRALDDRALATEIRALHSSVDHADSIESALAKVKMMVTPDDLILITGSLYLVGEARTFFHPLTPNASRTGALSGLKG
jgi:dihydrofolate synthase / folylpolyglutamate synthase